MSTLSIRELNRALQARQLLLERATLPVADAVERLAGLNAQAPNIPYYALWARLRGFAKDDLTHAIEQGSVVRSTLMRGTQHIVSAADFGWLRPAHAPLLARIQRNAFGTRTAGVDLEALVADARELLAGTVLTRPELGKLLAQSRPEANANALGWTAQYLLPIVHPAPSGTWNVVGKTPFALAEDVVGPVQDGGVADVQRMVRRYLAAFGPATTADMRTWCGVAGLREVVKGMRDELQVLRDEQGRELFDLPEAPRPPADTPAPVRLLPDFDGPLLAYADRSRLMTDEIRARVCVPDIAYATVLVDGMVAGMWTVQVTDDAAALAVEPLVPISDTDRGAIEAEATDLLAFASPDRPAKITWTA
jgi:Winged helix DNA-binding domain